MTERPLSITTQVATPIQTTFNSAASIAPNDALAVTESVDEEPYTIRCICDYSDDDGNTIYCEKCDTWQHIECYYPGQVVEASAAEFDHLCAECNPRLLDRHNATERQRNQRQNKASNDGGDKKSKRPPSKSHKKKAKPAELLVNGYHDFDDHRNGSPQEHPHTKKKGHRSTQSVTSQHKRSPPLNSRPNNHGHPPSPAHTPPDPEEGIQTHRYSANFLQLYNNDNEFRFSNSNSFASLAVTNSMSAWLRDPQRLLNDTGNKDPQAHYQHLTEATDVASLKWPALHLKTREEMVDGTRLIWKYLTLPTAISRPDDFIGILNGFVCFQKDYCEEPDSRWSEMPHPRPFFFFHPTLPLCIDARADGSLCRYVRRSCRPNTILETFIELKSTYHFWLVSERPLSANEQITLPWDFRFPKNDASHYLLRLILGDDEGPQSDIGSITEEEYNNFSRTIYEVLSEHGGCACNLGSDCAFSTLR